jgi:hypothetical protein
MRDIVAPLWNPSSLVLELRRKSLPPIGKGHPFSPLPIRPRPAAPEEPHHLFASLAMPQARAGPCRALWKDEPRIWQPSLGSSR